MAVSESELALILTARDNATAALQGLNKAIMGTKPAAETAEKAVTKMGSGSVREIGHMTHSAERIAGAFQSGSITGAVTGLFRLITTGMKTVEAEEAIMTLGLTALIVVLVGAAEKIKEMFGAAEEAAKRYGEARKELSDGLLEMLRAAGKKELADSLDIEEKRTEAIKKAMETYKGDEVAFRIALNGIRIKYDALDQERRDKLKEESNARYDKMVSDELAKIDKAEKEKEDRAKKAAEADRKSTRLNSSH
jgi:hypothetical protein